MKKKLLLIFLTCLLLITVLAVKAQDADNSYFAKLKLLKDMEGKPSPSFEATTLSGEKVNMESLKGKTIVLNFWFVGCIPCQEEMPLLNRLKKEFENDKNIIFLAFSRSTESETRNFLAKNSFDYDVVANAKNIAGKFNISGYPSNLIIDNKGIVRYTSIGSSDDIGNVLGQELKAIINNVKDINHLINH